MPASRERYVQLRFWTVETRIDLGAKIRAEKEMGREVFYHWNGHPLIMRERPPRRDPLEEVLSSRDIHGE